MAEKQYKNYDERFLKEESSGSRPVIKYYLGDVNEALDDGPTTYFKAKFEDGSYCQTLEDLLSLFRSGFIFAFEMPGYYTIYSNPMILMVRNGQATTISIVINFSSDSPELVYMVDAPTFEQLKQSKQSTS